MCHDNKEFRGGRSIHSAPEEKRGVDECSERNAVQDGGTLAHPARRPAEKTPRARRARYARRAERAP